MKPDFEPIIIAGNIKPCVHKASKRKYADRNSFPNKKNITQSHETCCETGKDADRQAGEEADKQTVGTAMWVV